MGIMDTEFGKKMRIIRNSIVFDEKWYKRIYGIRKEDAAAHYLLKGWKCGNDPSEFFSTTRYLQENPDVEASGMNPLVHWEVYGYREKKNNRYRFVNLEKLRAAYPGLLSDMQGGLLRLRVTNACNAKCRYCGVRLYFGSERDHMMDKSWLFDLCRPLYEKINFLLLTGGDPNITPHSYEFMKFISDQYPHITIFNETNGLMLKDKFQNLAADNMFRVHISLNSSSATIYDKSCWEGVGGVDAYERITANIESYLALLKEKGLEVFAPDYSMVINRDNYYDVVPFVRKVLGYHAFSIGFFFDYTENNMTSPYFSRPYESRMALKNMMEIERVLSGKVMVNFRLWVPTKELELMQEVVNREPEEKLKRKYADLLELAEGRSIVGEYQKRSELRKKAGKKVISFDEDYSSTIRLEEREGREICFAPWKELDLYPNGRLDFCGWYEPTLTIKDFMEDGKLDWNEVINSYAYMRGRYRILQGDYDECQDCCPMNDAANPILNVYEYNCPNMARNIKVMKRNVW